MAEEEKRREEELAEEAARMEVGLPPKWEWKWPEIKWPDFFDIGKKLVNLLLGGFEKFRDWIADGLKAFWEKVIPVKETLTKDLSESLRTSTPDWAKPLVNDLTHYFISYTDGVVDSVVSANPYIDPKYEGAIRERLKTYLMPAATAVIAASVAAQLAELLHPLRELRVSETVKNVLNVMGLFTVTNAIWNILYSEALIQPFKYELNSMVRPWLPPSSIVDTMLFQEGIDEEKWEEYYRKIGWSEEWIKAWKKARTRPPSVFIIYRVMEWPNTPEKWIDKVLRYHAYDEEDREILKEFFRWYALRDEFERYASKLN